MSRLLVASLVLVTTLGACAKSVVPEYEARKAAIEAAPTEVPAGWQGDGVLLLSDELVDRLVSAGLDKSGAFRRKVELGGRAHFTPDLSLKALSIVPSKRCEGCVQVDATLDGTCSWRIGNSTGDRPLGGHIVFDAVVEARRNGAVWDVFLKPRSVSKAELELGGRTFRTIQKLAKGAIDDWATEHVFDNLEGVRITSFEADLPLRAVRPAPSPTGLALELLTEAPAVDLVDTPTLEPGEDWALAVSQSALLHVAREEAFKEGEIAMKVAVEPTALQIDKGTFVLDLRLWRLAGRGWWRDYRVRGTWAKTASGFDFQAVEAKEGERSKGARVADPLAALAEGRILHAVEKAVSTSLPGGMNGQVGGIGVKPEVTRMGPVRDFVVVGGSASVGGAKRKAPAVAPDGRGPGGNR